MSLIPVARWQDLFHDAGRLRAVADGILVDNRCAPATGQEQEHHLRDAVAAACLRSPEDAVREAMRHHSKGVMLRRAAEQIERVAGFDESDRIVVDLGCGFGWHWVGQARRHPSVRFVLIDFSLKNLNVCRSLMPFEIYPNVLCIQASILDLPVRDSVAALAWSVQVLQHIAPSQRAVASREVRRILVPGGAFYIAWLRSVPVVHGVFKIFHRRYHMSGLTPHGYYLDRFSDTVEGDLRSVFPSGRLTRSESLFHPELRLRPQSEWIAGLDLALSRTSLGALFARQAEFCGSL